MLGLALDSTLQPAMLRNVQVCILLLNKCRQDSYVYRLKACLYSVDFPNQRTNLDLNLKQKTKNVNESATAKDKLVSFAMLTFSSPVHFFESG